MIFFEFETLDGRKCTVNKLKPFHIWIAQTRLEALKASNPNNEFSEYGVIPFILEQIVFFDGKKTNVSELGDLMIDDYLKLSDVLASVLSKIPVK